MIVVESTETMGAENTSRWLYPIWVALFGHVRLDDWNDIHHLIRKTGHFIGYGLVGLAFHRSWRLTLRERWAVSRWRLRRAAALIALACTVALAGADEIHQRFLPGRTSSIYDVGIDATGALTGQLLLFSGLAFFARRKNRELKETVPVSA